MKRPVWVLAIAVAVALLASSGAFADDVTRFEVESMKESSAQIAPVNDSDASGGQALRFTSRGEYATKSTYNFDATATRVQVRARATQVAGKWPQIRVFVDGAISGIHDVISPVIDDSGYAIYTGAVNIPPGNHAIYIKGLPGSSNLGTGDVAPDRRVWIDSIAFSFDADTAPAETTVDSGHEQGSAAQDGDAAGNVEPPPATSVSTPADCDSTVSSGESIDRAAEALGDGQALCIREGIYDQDVTLDNGGSEGSPITVAAYPGESVELRGNFKADPGASYLVVEGFKIDGSYGETISGSNFDSGDVHTRPAVLVNAPYTTWRNLDVSNRSPTDGANRSGNAFLVRDVSNTGTMIEGSTIHDWGEPGPGNNHVHGIYINADEFVIRDNIFYGNEGGDRAIQMYPDADNGTIEGNIIAYSNDVGIHFSGRGELTSGNNTVSGNVVSHTVEDRNVDAYDGQLCGRPGSRGECASRDIVTFPQSIEERNEFVDNCVYRGRVGPELGGIELTLPGDVDYFHAANNAVADPLYRDAAADDYRIRAGTECAAKFTGPASNTWTP